MDKISTPKNFTLSRDAIKQVVEAFSTRGNMEFGNKMLGPEPDLTSSSHLSPFLAALWLLLKLGEAN